MEATNLAEKHKAAEQNAAELGVLLAAKDAEINVLRDVAKSGGGDSVTAQVSATLASIQSQLTKIAPADVDAAVKTLADVIMQYRTAEAERQSLIDAKWKPTSAKVMAVDATLEQGRATLRHALSVVDRAKAAEYDRLQAIIDSTELTYQQLLKEVEPTHTDAIKLHSQLTQLQRQQEFLTAAKRRTTSRDVPSDTALMQIVHEESNHIGAKGRQFKIGDTITTPDGIKLAWIPAGTFEMGSPEGDPNRFADEKLHKVTISTPYFIGTHEVTIGQILIWLNSSGSRIEEEWFDLSSEDSPIKRNGNRYILNSASKFGHNERQPMVCVSWLGATAFCEWLSSREPGITYRLPTEAEFEFATRAGTVTTRYWGNQWSDEMANGGGGVTKAVGSYKQNPWGLYYTLGNCWEWCSDWYGENYYQSSPAEDPQGPSSGTDRVFRGGGGNDYPASVRSAYRNWDKPDRCGDNVGFRIACGCQY
ncbi:MAG: SUMF1/EgtB/PvdO family nonheme iron enzyme [Planctomycetales bacterium]|nr:SUMF1/EgtB/PvdO family nonheme iron enzyme [Planctomycetales bacterium]